MKFADLADSALESTIIPSFSRIGPLVRSRLEHWNPPVDHDLEGRVIVITGATSGLGLVAARAWLTAGATVEIVARNPTKARITVERLRAEIPGAKVDVVIADTGNYDQIRNSAATIRGRHDVIHALIHNAGALEADFATAPSGLERTVASQVVGPFLLSSLLYESLCAAKPGRIVWVTSGGMYTEPLSVDLLSTVPSNYRGAIAYARAKRAQVTLVEMMSERVESSNLVVNAMHPGWTLTPGVQRSLPTFRKVMGPLLRTPEQGADTLIWLVANDGEPVTNTGGLWLDRRERTVHRRSTTRNSDTPEERVRLWQWVTNEARSDFPPISP